MTKAVLAKVRREPALLVGLVTAVLILLTEFGVELTAGQQAAIVGVVIATGALVVRQSVTPNASVAAKEEGDRPGAVLVAGDASSLPNETEVDVTPAERIYGDEGYDPRHD